MDEGAISTRFLANPKARSAPARLVYSKQTPIGGNSAVQGQTVRIKLPSNRVGTYFDASASFLQFKVGGFDKAATLSPSGVLGLIKNIVVRNTGNYLSTIDRYDILSNVLIKNNTENEEFLSRDGKVIMLTADATNGKALTAGTTYDACIFLTDLGHSIFEADSYLPLYTADSIEIDLVLSDSLTATKIDSTSNGQFSLTDISLNLATIEVPPGVDGNIIQQHGGMFKYLCNNVGHYQSSIQSGVSAHTFNIGMSYSSVNKVTAVMMVQGPLTTDHAISNFIKAGLKKAQLMVDGVPVMNALGIESSSNAVNLCYARIAQHALVDTEVNMLTAGDNYTTENFLVSFDLDTIAGKSDALRSGLNVSASVTQLVLEFDAPTTAALDLHVFVNYDAMISMDLNGTRNFEISV